MHLLFQLKIIIPDLDRGRKINLCSFSSLNLNMEHVTFSYTVHFLDTQFPLFYPHIRSLQNNERREERERGEREGKKKDNPREIHVMPWGKKII